MSLLIMQVVASMDWPEVTKYRGMVSAQAHREEIIQDLYNSYQHPQKGFNSFWNDQVRNCHGFFKNVLSRSCFYSHVCFYAGTCSLHIEKQLIKSHAGLYFTGNNNFYHVI